METSQTKHQMPHVDLHNTSIKRLVRFASDKENPLDEVRKLWKGSQEQLDHLIELTRFRYIRGAKLSRKERQFYALVCR